MHTEKNTEDNLPVTTPPKRSKAQRIAALICVIALAGLYLVTLAVAIFDRSSSGRWFMFCVFATIFLPFLAWIYIWMYGVLAQKRTIASFHLGEPDDFSPEDAGAPVFSGSPGESEKEAEKKEPAN